MQAIERLGATPLVTAPFGGVLKSGRRSVIVERTLLTARSIEFDAVVVAAGTTPDRRHQAGCVAAGGIPALQGRLARGVTVPHALTAAGIDLDGPGVLVADGVDKAFTDGAGRARSACTGCGNAPST